MGVKKIQKFLLTSDLKDYQKKSAPETFDPKSFFCRDLGLPFLPWIFSWIFPWIWNQHTLLDMLTPILTYLKKQSFRSKKGLRHERRIPSFFYILLLGFLSLSKRHETICSSKIAVSYCIAGRCPWSIATTLGFCPYTVCPQLRVLSIGSMFN